MKKQSKIIIAIITVLIIIIGITVVLNKENVEEKRSLNNDAIFMAKYKGEIIKEYTLEEIRALGEVSFTATKDTSKDEPIEHTYIGVPLIKIFEDAGIEVLDSDVVVNVAADGYAVALEAEKILDSSNVYLAYIVDDNAIGTRDEGGNGPYQIIVSEDQFSQYWCKYALSTDVQ